MTFTDKQQKDHRDTFIKECRQKAWGAACHAGWISHTIDGLLAEYQKLQAEDKVLETAIKEADNAIDYHTVENRQKRKAMQERRNTLGEQMKVVAQSAQQGTQTMHNLLTSAESNLELAKHAEEWSWKEVETKADEHKSKDETIA